MIYVGLAAAFFVVGFIVSFFIVNEMLFKRFFCRADKNVRENSLNDAHYLPVKDEMIKAAEQMEKLPKKEYFIRSNDGLKLFADYFKGDGETLIIMAHGLHSVPSYNFGIIALEAVKLGYGLLVIDERAHGRSEGKYSTYGFKEGQDLVDWINFAAKTFPEKRIFLYGVSMGAAAIGFASDKITESKVKGGIIDCGFISSSSIFEYIVKTRRLPGFLFRRYLYYRAKHKIKFDTVKNRADECVKNSRIPLLFIHGEKDDVAPFEGGLKMYESCGSKKEFYSVKEAGHTTSVVFDEKAREKLFDFIKEN